MSDKLQPYRDKRNFKITNEPSGGVSTQGQAMQFVIQKHAARRLHYDFRLELGGTLKSWAVPKGPSLDPLDKRMAVHVEDHPLAYATFEGVIPPKQYGAGTVIVWDRGTWIPEGDPEAAYAAGKLKFELRGEKLAGHWTLVRMRGRGQERQEPWLLIKERDAHARPAAEFSVVDALPDSVLGGTDARAAGRPGAQPADGSTARKAAAGRTAATKTARKTAAKTATKTAKSATKTTKGATKTAARKSTARQAAAAPRTPLPLTLSPQLATLVAGVPADNEWIYEIKFDGYRLLTRADGADLRLFTRNGHDWTSRMKPLARDLKALGLQGTWLDGEIIVTGENGGADFQALQNAFDTARTDDIQYFVFDLPFHDGEDLRERPLVERRERLRALLEGAASPRIRYSEDFPVDPGHLLHTACAMRMEGVIGKRRDAPYTGGRSGSWIKLKCTQRQEFVIGGYTDPKGSRQGLGSLLLGVHDAAGHLRYAGNVGTGFTAATLRDVRDKLLPLAADKPPFTDLPRDVKGHWVRPKLVAEISFAEWTKDDRVRQAVFHGLRTDKPPRTIVREQPAAVPGPAGKKVRATAGAKAASRDEAEATVKTPPQVSSVPPSRPRKGAAAAGALAGIRLTHPERVIDASTGITKAQLADYYARAARRMLPHLVQRPVSLVRGPDGIGGELFFQKHGEKLRIPGIVRLDRSLDPDHPPLLEVASAEALLGSVQMNVIEFHTWNATTAAIDQPDRMTFDLDPGEGVPWPHMQEAAALVRVLLQELELESFLKTSGGKGLHVVVPFKPALGWDEVKGLSQALVQHLARTLPTRFVSKSGPRNRVGKIFVDYLRNGRGATTACAWSARARPGMGVSVPVDWSELPQLTSGAHWTVRTVDERLAAPDPWAAYGKTTKQTLKAALKAMG